MAEIGVLAPDAFEWSAGTASPAVPLPRWRATPQARQAWRSTLESRVQQQASSRQALQSVVGAVPIGAILTLNHRPGRYLAF